MTLADIRDEFSVSRRTAERLRDAVEATFGPLETVDADSGDRRIRWRLRSPALHPFIQVSPEELADLEATVGSLDRGGLTERAARLRDLKVKLRAASRRPSGEEFDVALASLMEAEGLAMRAGPREYLEDGLLSLVRSAIMARRKVEFDYLSRGTGRQGGATNASGPMGCSTGTALSWWDARTEEAIQGFGGLPMSATRESPMRNSSATRPSTCAVTPSVHSVRSRKGPSKSCSASTPVQRRTPRGLNSIRARVPRKTATVP